MSSGLIEQSTYGSYLEEGELRKKLERILTSTPTELVSLFDEIAFCRAAAQDAIQMYAAGDQITDANIKLRHKMMALDMVHKSFARIESLSLTASKIDQYNRTSSAVQMAKVIIDECISTAERHFRIFVPPQVVERFAEELRGAFEITDGAGEVGAKRRAEAIAMKEQMDLATQANVIEVPPQHSSDLNRKNVVAVRKPDGPTPEIVKG